MKKLTDILKLDLKEDIKNVIDLEDQNEDEIQSEIEQYILTNGLAEHLSGFIKKFNSNIKESGVWISGFYGSGKSYFGKILGHLIQNKNINGTEARDRFLPRIAGVKNESFLEQDIRSLDSIQSLVVFFDSAKQNTENGFSWTLFSNFLKVLGYRSDIYGMMEYDLMLEGKYPEFEKAIKKVSKEDWSVVKRSPKKTAMFVRRAYMEMGLSEKEYDDVNQLFKSTKNDFSPAVLRDELKKYLTKNTDTRIVFIFDETSEAINQKKYTLLDLEGISESLSSFGNKVWTLAIAQEKLDDVINNSNFSKSTLIKVTDRFKTKLHLAATEVDTIIRNRLLQKEEKAYTALEKYFNSKEGQLKDLTNLKSKFPTITNDASSFATYYPFHKYQFNLLQKFLFTSNQLAASQIAARGMIITTFDVLRNQLKDLELYNSATGYQICREAQSQPPSELGIKYEGADKVLKNQGSEIQGKKLMEVINFLDKSEVTDTTIENITKSYISDAERYYDTRPKIEEALNDLVETKILLLKNQNYTITSNIESQLLDEMNNITVEIFNKKRFYIDYLKSTKLFSSVAGLQIDGLPYKFNVLSDNEDEIETSSNKHLKIRVHSPFNMGNDREEFLEGVKMETQGDKQLITIVPNTEHQREIEKLIEETRRFSLMEDKYGNDNDQTKKQIIREFSAIKDEKEISLRNKIKESFLNGSLVYLFDDFLLNELNFKTQVESIQEKVIKNVYTKRLNAQLSEEIGKKVLIEKDAQRLSKLFTGADFGFFDTNGNFIGENLKIVEEIKSFITSKYCLGKDLELELKGVPWGYGFGTLSSTLAVLFRAGKIVVKHNATEYFDWKDKDVREVFSNSRKFGSASYKSISQSLNAQQKNDIVTGLQALDFKEVIGQKVDWNTTDFELAHNITQLSEHYLTVLKERQKDLEDFDNLFPNAVKAKDLLQAYNVKTTEANYIDKANNFLNTKEDFQAAIRAVDDSNQFIRKNLDKLRGLKRYMDDVKKEVQKSQIVSDEISSAYDDFMNSSSKNIVEHFSEMEQSAQQCRDAYYKLCSVRANEMIEKYSTLSLEIGKMESQFSAYPKDINRSSFSELSTLKSFVSSKTVADLKMEYHTTCQNCSYSLSDFVSYIDLYPSKQSQLEILENSFIKEAPKADPSPKTKKGKAIKSLSISIPDDEMTVKQYKSILATQIQSMAGMDNEDMVKVNKN